jgi:hypothetical protein
MAVITGIEHFILKDKVYNLTAVILPFKIHTQIPTAAVFFQIKKNYSPHEKRIIEGFGKKAMEGGKNYARPLYHWNNCYFPVFCCYELTSIEDRAKFISYADLVVAVELNRDTNYFGNIIESLTRDLHCYCLQVNTSEYGDSRITQPKKTEEANLIKVKGGKNATVLIDAINISKLREFQIQSYELQQDEKIQRGNGYKPTPVGIDKDIVRRKIANDPVL